MREVENAYFLSDSIVEVGRLLHRDQLVTKYIETSFPACIEINKIHRVLDVVCGPGGWTIELAKKFPHIQVLGIDSRETMLQYAEIQKWAHGVKNVFFSHMDVHVPFEFEEATFDWINARFIAGLMMTTDWLPFTRECFRVLRPGGWLRLLEGDTWRMSDSPAIAKLCSHILKAFERTGKSFSAEGFGQSFIHQLHTFLSDTGFQRVESVVYSINSSYGTPAYHALTQNFVVALEGLRPFLIDTQILPKDVIHLLFSQAIDELNSSDYHGCWYLPQICGQKPKG